MSPPFLNISVTFFQNKVPKKGDPSLLPCIYSISSLNAGKGEIFLYSKQMCTITTWYVMAYLKNEL